MLATCRAVDDAAFFAGIKAQFVGVGFRLIDMRVILFRATGMVGKGGLRQCLLDPGLESVLCIGRKPSGASHPKLRDLIRSDMFDFPLNAGELSSYDSCFFCLGVSSVGMGEADYTHLTYDLTLGWARALAAQNPAMRFLYVSGHGHRRQINVGAGERPHGK
jgi:hypothetical protein